MSKDEWINKWANPQHQQKKLDMFNIVDSYINFEPKTILDIGCGLAVESELFQKKYNCNLYLLDGDFDTTVSRKRKVNYGSDTTMAFYSKVPDLMNSWNERKLKYTFIDANDISIDSSIKFDLIYSFESCGFHYPANSYAELIKKHSHENTVCIFDIRTKTYAEQSANFQTVKKIHTGHKFETTVLKFK
tara:strand:- start:4930 stop:5496 length:567 start_codon:yes stop_codon:yes gene_type:complete